jgi:hypothetical protein
MRVYCAICILIADSYEELGYDCADSERRQPPRIESMARSALLEKIIDNHVEDPDNVQRRASDKTENDGVR